MTGVTRFHVDPFGWLGARTDGLARQYGLPATDLQKVMDAIAQDYVNEQADDQAAWRNRRSRLETGGLVYYLQDQDRDAVKIGTSTCLDRRISTLVREHRRPLLLLATHGGGRRSEQIQHAQFAHLRISGEWFRHAPPLRTHIQRIANRHSQEPRLYTPGGYGHDDGCVCRYCTEGRK